MSSNEKMPSETDVIPKAISGMDGLGRDWKSSGYAKSTFGAYDLIQLVASSKFTERQIKQ